MRKPISLNFERSVRCNSINFWTIFLPKKSCHVVVFHEGELGDEKTNFSQFRELEATRKIESKLPSLISALSQNQRHLHCHHNFALQHAASHES